MIADLKPYPEMKDSGASCLGQVPEHWEVLRAKFFLREVDERSLAGDEDLLSVSHKTGVTPRREKNVTMFLAESNVGHKLCRSGDVVVNTMWAWMAALGLSRQTGIVSPSYGVYRPRSAGRFLTTFLDELLRTSAYRSEYVVRSTGIRDSRLRLYPDAFLGIPILCPKIAEQTAIVRFLDHADRRIRRYISAKQKLIKLLEEQKQAIIHGAVTRGLDPNVRLKPSGVEWLGGVPEHWEVWQIGHFAVVGNGSTPSRGNAAFWVGGEFPWLNSSSVHAGTIMSASQFVTEQALRECHLPRVSGGSVLVAITGQGKTRGTAAVLGIEATINQHIAFITPRPANRRSASAEYLRAFLVAAYSELRRISDDSGSTKGALTCEDLRHFRVALGAAQQ